MVRTRKMLSTQASTMRSLVIYKITTQVFDRQTDLLKVFLIWTEERTWMERQLPSSPTESTHSWVMMMMMMMMMKMMMMKMKMMMKKMSRKILSLNSLLLIKLTLHN